MKYLTIGNTKLRINLINMNKIISTPLTEDETKQFQETLTFENGETKREEKRTQFPPEKRIDSTKYEVIRLALEIVLTTDFELPKGDFDEIMDNLPFNVKIALNTLIAYRIIEEIKEKK